MLMCLRLDEASLSADHRLSAVFKKSRFQARWRGCTQRSSPTRDQSTSCNQPPIQPSLSYVLPLSSPSLPEPLFVVLLTINQVDDFFWWWAIKMSTFQSDTEHFLSRCSSLISLMIPSLHWKQPVDSKRMGPTAWLTPWKWNDCPSSHCYVSSIRMSAQHTAGGLDNNHLKPVDPIKANWLEINCQLDDFCLHF